MCSHTSEFTDLINFAVLPKGWFNYAEGWKLRMVGEAAHSPTGSDLMFKKTCACFCSVSFLLCSDRDFLSPRWVDTVSSVHPSIHPTHPLLTEISFRCHAIPGKTHRTLWTSVQMVLVCVCVCVCARVCVAGLGGHIWMIYGGFEHTVTPEWNGKRRKWHTTHTMKVKGWWWEDMRKNTFMFLTLCVLVSSRICVCVCVCVCAWGITCVCPMNGLVEPEGSTSAMVTPGWSLPVCLSISATNSLPFRWNTWRHTHAHARTSISYWRHSPTHPWA